MTRQMLLLSSSKIPANGKWLDYAQPRLGGFFGDISRPIRHVAFVPYAGVTIPHDRYTEMAESVFATQLGFRVSSVHATRDPAALLAEADAILVGGGNTWVLNQALHERALVEIIRQRVLEDGVPYVGWSAGSVVAFGGMETTNDMNIVRSPVLPGLGLITGGLRLNPHFLDALLIERMGDVARTLAEELVSKDQDAHRMLLSRGESRADRLAEYLQVQRPDGSYVNDGPVIGLYEGSMLRVDGNTMTLTGEAGAKVFSRAASPTTYESGADLSFLFERK